MNLYVEPAMERLAVPQGDQVRLRFKLVAREPARRAVDRRDLELLALRVPGCWHRWARARCLGAGVYGADFPVPGGGEYHLFFACPSQGAGYSEFPHLVLHITASEVRTFTSTPHPGSRELVC